MEDLQQAQNKHALYAAPSEQKRSRIRWLVIIGGLILIVAAAGAAVYEFVIKKHSSSSSGGDGNTSSGSPSTTGSPKGNDFPVSGGTGSTVYLQDGTTFTYTNSFGGTWYYDPNNPYANYAQAQSYTPPLNQTFKYGTDRIYGVNLGGWLNTEPFIAPALYEPYLNAATPAIDEWTLSENIAADTANGGFQILENHYATFITEKDFADIAAAGLNHVRIPIPYWAISKFDNEPFYEGAQWKYVVKAIGWARKYGIRINLDLHAHPGSQNGFNHAGVLNAINWMYGTMGIANAQRSLDIVRTIAEFISQDEYKDVVTMFGLVNEPQLYLLGQDVVGHFYYQAHNIIRNITGIGEGNGAWLVIHDGFNSDSNYTGYLAGADRVALDTHPYLCFQALVDEGPEGYAAQACPTWAGKINTTTGNYGFVHAGEWSLGYTDCGQWLTGVNQGTRYEGNYSNPNPNPKIGNCADILDYTTWNATYKQGLMDFASASMDVLQNWFFWNWKIGNSSATGLVGSPHWSYQLGLSGGWLPTDPRKAQGTCASQGVSSPLGAPLSGYQTGGPGAGTWPADQVSSYGDWPPSSLSGVIAGMTGLPVYVQTGSQVTLSAPNPTYAPSQSPSVTINLGNGWANPSDTAAAYVPIDGCNYPFQWSATNSAYPGCTPSLKKRVFDGEKWIVVPEQPLTLPSISTPTVTPSSTSRSSRATITPRAEVPRT
ncbi:glycoside hydrolase family 5 protein [Clavulina sp. PMI_390]|nr:glycoside hydrolase family 5 protein [Clavulina sp. PMI_390]